MKFLRKTQKEMLEIKYYVAEVENVFDELISRLDTTVKRIFEPEAISIKISKTEKHME